MVDEPDSNRRPTARAAAQPLSFRPLETSLPASGIRHGSAARTGRACEPEPLEAIRTMLRIDAKPASIPSPTRTRPPPVPGIGAQRLMLHAAAAPHSGNPFLRAVDARMPGMRIVSADFLNQLHSRTRKKSPRTGSEGVRVSSEDRVPIFRRRKISRWWAAVPCDRRRSGDTRARALPGRGVRAADRAGLRCGRNASWL